MITEQQIVNKIHLLNPLQMQTVSAFLDFLLSKQTDSKSLAALLNISTWDTQSLQEIENAAKSINQWQPETF